MAIPAIPAIPASPPRATSAAIRQRRRRKLRKAGKRSYRLALDEADTESALEEAGLISPMSEPTHQDIEAALTVLLTTILQERHA